MKIKINNKEFLFFNNFSVKLNLDSFASSFSFLARFNPENIDHRQLFKPLSYPKIQVFKDDGTLLLTGVIIDQEFNSSKDKELIKLSGYSSGGVLEDCTIPYSAYPLESINRSLKDISEKLLNLFGLKLVVNKSALFDSNLIYKKSVAGATESIKSYISKLASQRNIVISHNAMGHIIYFKPSATSSPKILFNQENTVVMSFKIKGQGMHNEASVLRQPSDDNENLSPVDTARNPLVKSFRPTVKVLSSGTDTDTSKAADNLISSELKNLQLIIKVPRWEDLFPGDLVEAHNHEIYLFRRTRFMIKSVTFNEKESGKTMNLSLVLPETYTGGKPKINFNNDHI